MFFLVLLYHKNDFLSSSFFFKYIFLKSIPHTLTICKFLIYSISMRDTFLSIEN